jgi:hypothetical protein
MSQANYSLVYDAAQVRLKEFGEHIIELESDDLPDDLPVGQLVDLYQGLETAARLPTGPEQDAVLGDLMERYALGAVGIDPFLRAQLPAIPTTGAVVRRLVLGVNGGVARVNSAFVGVGAALVPAPVVESKPASPITAPEPAPASGTGTVPTATMPLTTPFTNQLSVTVVHNLGRIPLVQVFDMSGQEIDASLQSDLNSVTVTFSQPLSGTLSLY